MERAPKTGELHRRGTPCRPAWPDSFRDGRVAEVAQRLRRIFDSLPHLGYLGVEELRDYCYYEAIIAAALVGIDSKALSGNLRPFECADYPRRLECSSGRTRTAIYIGSFDPFQLTHLAIALKFLASPRSESDVVFVVPEGAKDIAKPSRTDYRFRFQIAQLQLSGVLEPFVLPLDIGEGADTIEIVRRFVAMHADHSLELTHLVGSDVVPLAARFIAQDMEVWERQARASRVDYTHCMYVARRSYRGVNLEHLERIRGRNVEVTYDRSIVGTPSSTDFRENGAITLALPTVGMREKLEIAFRYNMNRPWSSRP